MFGWFEYGLVGFCEGGCDIGRFVCCNSSANCDDYLVEMWLTSCIVEIDPTCRLYLFSLTSCLFTYKSVAPSSIDP